MELVYVDPEPPGSAGGGIRTYLRLALGLCRDAGVPARVYTHTPEAYPGHAAFPIGRKPWLAWPWRGLLYRLAYHDNVLWEHARWLRDELEREDAPDRIHEFADFHGYAFFALRSWRLRPRCIVRVHTPGYLTLAPPRTLKERMAAALMAFRERDGLTGRARITAPSAAFLAERLPWVKGALHLPNPLPLPPCGGSRAPVSGAGTGPRILYLGRIEARKGVLTLLAGFLQLAKRDPGPTLALAGADVQPYAGKVRSLLEAAPPALRARVTWVGPCSPEERDALLGRSDILAVPSLWENSPYVYFEGMAAGLLCVGSATGEMREAAAATGGPLATPGDPDDWTRILEEAAAAWRETARRDHLLAAQRAYLEERRAGIAERMLACYRDLAAEAGEAEEVGETGEAG